MGRKSTFGVDGEALIASVCVTGEPATQARTNTTRARLLERIVAAITAQQEETGRHADAVLLPGGYFYLPERIEAADFTTRRAALEAAPFAADCRKAAEKLPEGAYLVVGIDGARRQSTPLDQWCVAWTPEGVAGLGRKIFPTDGEAEQLVVYESDFAARERAITLASGRRALLCACYDMFGVSEPHQANRARIAKIKHIGGPAEHSSAGTPRFGARCDAALLRWHDLIEDGGFTVGLAAIHSFPRSGAGSGRSMWQRHGVATCSAALHGGLAVGASHFERLPASEKTTLAAKKVPARHLGEAQRRKALEKAPLWTASLPGKALIRWFA